MANSKVCAACGHENGINRQTCEKCQAPLLGIGGAEASQIPIRYADADQETASLQHVASDIARMLTPTEEILYIALQNVTALSIKKDAVVATSNRLILYRPSILGRIDFQDFQWQDVRNATIKQGVFATDFTVFTTDGREAALTGLHKSQAQRLYSVCQQMEQEWREKRRVREMEEDRARSGGTYITPAPVAQAPAAAMDDPVEKLKKAKQMLDNGLISEAEYETVKAKLLASM